MSNLYQRIFNIQPKGDKATPKEEKTEERTLFTGENFGSLMGSLNFSSSDLYTNARSLNVAIAFRCIDLISNSIAVLEFNNFTKKGNWNSKQYNKLYELLNISPNRFMSSFTFKKQMVQYILCNGNAYILIQRDANDEISKLVLLDPNTVQVLAIDGQIYYNVIATSYYNLPLVTPNVYGKDDIIHIKNYSLNGFVGISTLDFASMVMSTAWSSEVQANNFFRSNSILTGILKPSAGTHLTEEKAKTAKAAFLANLNSSINTAGTSIIVLDSGLDYQSIQTNPKDAALIENRKFSGLQIAEFFGVPPTKVFLDERVNTRNNESEQVEFLNSCLLPLIEKIESEFFYKVVLPIDYQDTDFKADVSNLLRLQALEQASVWTQLFQLGAIQTNEIREKLEMDSPVKGGNRSYVSQNIQPLDQNLNDIKAGVVTPSGDTKTVTPNNNFNTNNTNNGK
jgi:HK97 family phage portal protein